MGERVDGRDAQGDWDCFACGLIPYLQQQSQTWVRLYCSVPTVRTQVRSCPLFNNVGLACVTTGAGGTVTCRYWIGRQTFFPPCALSRMSSSATI